LLADADPADFGPDYMVRSAGVTLDAARIRSRRGEAIAWMREVLAGYGRLDHPSSAASACTSGRWSNRQSADELRHADWPLRLTAAENRGRR